jgi:hypothetical protein
MKRLSAAGSAALLTAVLVSPPGADAAINTAVTSIGVDPATRSRCT